MRGITLMASALILAAAVPAVALAQGADCRAQGYMPGTASFQVCQSLGETSQAGLDHRSGETKAEAAKAKDDPFSDILDAPKRGGEVAEAKIPTGADLNVVAGPLKSFSSTTNPFGNQPASTPPGSIPSVPPSIPSSTPTTVAAPVITTPTMPTMPTIAQPTMPTMPFSSNQ